MNVVSTGPSPALVRLPEPREAPGPDRIADGDGDDRPAATPPAPPAGMGTRLDKTV